MTGCILWGRLSLRFPGYPLPASEPVTVPGFLVPSPGATMVAQFVAALEPSLSKVRFEAYRPAGPTTWRWSSTTSSMSSYQRRCPGLQAFEVALRNSIHGTLSSHFATEFWFDSLWAPPYLATRCRADRPR